MWKHFKLALTRLWEATDVHVDWSRPVDYVKNGIRSLKRFIKYIIGYKKLHLIFIFMNLLNVVFLF